MSEQLPFNPEQLKTPEQLKEWGERFRRALVEAGLASVEEQGIQVPLETLLDDIEDERSFLDLSTEEQKIILTIINDELGIDVTNEDAEPSRTYITQGTPGTLGEGPINVSVYAASKDGFFLRRYQYADGKTGYSIGPETTEDEQQV